MKTLKATLLIAVLTALSLYSADAQYAREGGALYYRAGNVYGSAVGEVIVKNCVYEFNPEAPEMHLPIIAWMGAAVGGTLVLVSVPLYWVGTVKLKKAAGAGSTGSVAYTPELSFVTQSGGIGLALNF